MGWHTSGMPHMHTHTPRLMNLRNFASLGLLSAYYYYYKPADYITIYKTKGCALINYHIFQLATLQLQMY